MVYANRLILWQNIGVNRKIPVIRVGVIAKYQWYIDDAIKVFSSTGIALQGFLTLDEFKEEIKGEISFDFLFFPHFSEVIPVEIYSKFLCIGFHTGDLPNDRGGSPIQYKILEKKYKTRVSAFRIDEKLDAGPIYLHKNIDLAHGDILQILKKLSKICALMMKEIVLKQPKPLVQALSTSPRKRLKYSDSNLGALNLSLESLYDRIRMVDGLDYPKAFIELGNFRLEFSKARFDGNTLVVSCKIQEGEVSQNFKR